MKTFMAVDPKLELIRVQEPVLKATHGISQTDLNVFRANPNKLFLIHEDITTPVGRAKGLAKAKAYRQAGLHFYYLNTHTELRPKGAAPGNPYTHGNVYVSHGRPTFLPKSFKSANY